MLVVPKSGRPVYENDQWYIVQGNQRYRAEFRSCEGCKRKYLCSNGTKKTKRRFCSSECASQTSWLKPAGATKLLRDGYVFEKVEGNRWRMQHRLVVERALGRPLRPDESVHHINGDRANNDLSNLQLRTSGHGRGQVAHCLDCGSSNVGFECL